MPDSLFLHDAVVKRRALRPLEISETGAELTGKPLRIAQHFPDVIGGGYATTIDAISHGMWLLLRHPDQMAKLRANMDLIDNFVEEVIRFDSPVQGLFRRATEDTEVGGVTIPKDSMVMVRYAAANRDEAQFPDANRFYIERKNASTHVGFGYGVHFCLGRMIARLEMRSSFRALLTRLDNIELARPLTAPFHHPSMLFRPFRELPIRFTKAS